jgi:uncharacterized membrane protein HdeD (DUF308 family)
MPKDVTTILNRAWWGLVLRGLVSITLGLFIFARPLESVAAFALVIAIWALVDGFTNIVHSFDLKPLYNHWWLMLLGGIVSVGFGMAALFFYPVLSLAFAVVWAAWWLILTGSISVYVSVQQKAADLPWGWTMAFGILSIVAGGFAFYYQGATLAAIMGLISGFAVVGGIIMLIGAFKLKSAQSDVQRVVRSAL